MNGTDFEQGRTAVRDRIKTPSFSAIVTTSRRRRHRRQLGGAAAVAVVALAGGAVVMTTHAFDRGGMPAAGSMAAQPWSLSQPSSIINEFPLDGRQAYAVLGIPQSEGANAKRMALAHTTDGGQSWSAFEIPPKYVPRTFGQGPTISFENGKPVVHPDTSQTPVHLIGALVLNETTVLSTTGLTRDGGRTWQEVPDAYGEPIDAAESGWVTVLANDQRLVAIDPETGVQHPYRQQPGLTLYNRPNWDLVIHPASDGSLWVIGEAPSGHDKAVAVSRDHGRSWTTHVFAGTGGAGDLWVATADGRTVYAVRGTLLNRSDPIIRAESTDGGQTWSAFTPVTGLRIPIGLEVAADGALLSADTTIDGNGNPVQLPALISRDGGRTFVANGAIGTARTLTRTVTGGLLYTSMEGHRAVSRQMFSSDGRTFATVPMPPNAK
jgi:hypothetical protein